MYCQKNLTKFQKSCQLKKGMCFLLSVMNLIDLCLIVPCLFLNMDDLPNSHFSPSWVLDVTKTFWVGVDVLPPARREQDCRILHPFLHSFAAAVHYIKLEFCTMQLGAPHLHPNVKKSYTIKLCILLTNNDRKLQHSIKQFRHQTNKCCSVGKTSVNWFLPRKVAKSSWLFQEILFRNVRKVNIWKMQKKCAKSVFVRFVLKNYLWLAKFDLKWPNLVWIGWGLVKSSLILPFFLL